MSSDHPNGEAPADAGPSPLRSVHTTNFPAILDHPEMGPAARELYRLLLKPWLGNACRFEPTCSAYAMQALHRHGAMRGTALAGWRVMRCHPWCAGGNDPVPGVEPAAFPSSSEAPSARPPNHLSTLPRP